MKIYLACTVRGDRGAVGTTRRLADLLEELGHDVLTRHLLLDDADAREGQLTERDVFERDVQFDEPDGTLGTVCVYQAVAPEALVEHARRVGMPAEDIVEVVDTAVIRADPVAAQTA